VTLARSRRSILATYSGVTKALQISPLTDLHKSVRGIAYPAYALVEMVSIFTQTKRNLSQENDMPVTQHVSDMIAAARQLIESISVTEAAELQKNGAAVLIDLRDIRELQQMGTIPNAVHALRGMLEFWADPRSPYHRSVFHTDGKLILFCAFGLRSALAVRTLQDMGMGNVCDMNGGFTEWRMQRLPTDVLV